jgi:pyruvate formate lyase activating enzyme
LIDYPGEVACTLFMSGCNLRCAYCYNPALVKRQPEGFTISEAEIFSFLEERRSFLDGVCITGGEPLLSFHLLFPFLKKLKTYGLKVKLDTNGCFPKELRKLIEAQLIDYIAMDIKASPEKYEGITRTAIKLAEIKASVSLVKNSGLDYEFRTTVHTGLKREDFEKIARWLEGSKQYFLQSIKVDVPLLEEGFAEKAYAVEEIKTFARVVEKYVNQVGIRS